MTTSSQNINIKTFIRMDAAFIRNILPHVNVSVAGEGHYLYACISPKSAQKLLVAAWLSAQDQAAIAESYLDNETFTFSDERILDKNLKYIVVGMSLSQLNYCQLVTLDDEHCHRVVKLPSDRTIPCLVPTKNPLIFRDPNDPEYLYFARNRAMEQMINLTR